MVHVLHVRVMISPQKNCNQQQGSDCQWQERSTEPYFKKTDTVKEVGGSTVCIRTSAAVDGLIGAQHQSITKCTIAPKQATVKRDLLGFTRSHGEGSVM